MTAAQIFALLPRILGAERSFYVLAVLYGIGVSLLSLALPISVQMLINTVANTGLAQPLIVLSVTLFALLMASGLLRALRIHLLEIFGRRFYARQVSKIALTALYSRNPMFSDCRQGPLFNRYFDIVIIQKAAPYLLIGGFTVLLQAAVGFVVVSLYHPYFLAFNLVFILLLWLVWQIWGGSAARSAVNLSHKKHASAAWLEGLASSDGFYKSQRQIDHAIDGADRVTGDYVKAHRVHFRRFFAQTIIFFTLYAAASAILLGLGGWLVIQGQLTVGQLVAAELILSAVFFGVSQFGSYLNSFYELCGAVEELSLFEHVKLDEPAEGRPPISGNSRLEFNGVIGDARGRRVRLDFELPHGVRVLALAADHGLQRLLTDLLKRHAEPTGGFITLGGSDLQSADIHALRRQITVLDRPKIIEATIRDYLSIAAPAVPPPREVLAALEAVGLTHTMELLPDGLDTELSSTGWPLSIVETLKLKLAGAILARPTVLILNQLYDALPEADLVNALNTFEGPAASSVIYFSNRGRNLGFDGVLKLTDKAQAYEPGVRSLSLATPHSRTAPTELTGLEPPAAAGAGEV